LASVACLVLLCLNYSASKAQNTNPATGQLDPNQTYTTGNIVQDTPQGGPTPWVNGVYQNNLTCWTNGDPGYCGPNAIVRPGNNINFSYGSTYLYQQQHISTLLPSVTGLQVIGYNFGFTAKNGNGWDDGRTDSLIALVRFWDNTGGKATTNLLYGNSYDLNSKFNWTSLNYSETFTSPLAVPSIGQVQYGFIGKDNNSWAGPYGPEVNSVSFSLKYKVDPCASNVLSSPTCPGYFDALAKLTPQSSSTVTEASQPPTIADSGATIQSGQTPSPSGSQSPTQTASASPVDGTQTQPTVQVSGQSISGATSPIQQASMSQPSATNPQLKIGEVSDTGGGSKSAVSLSSVLSMINSNQEKTAALEKSVVQSADNQAFSAGETAKATAEKIAGDVQSQSIAASNSQSTSAIQIGGGQAFSSPMQNSAVSIQGNLQSNTVLNTARQEQASASATAGQQSTAASGTTQQQNTSSATNLDGMSIGFKFSLLSPRYEPPKFESSYTLPAASTQYTPPARQEFSAAMESPAVSYSLMAPARHTSSMQLELPSADPIKFGYKGPVDNAIETKPFLPEINASTQSGSEIKKNVQNNEIAGSVTVESMATQPQGYAAYSFTLADAQFYTPKEIYKNQNNVDNARALRQLGSDKLHQQMVDQQYR